MPWTKRKQDQRERKSTTLEGMDGHGQLHDEGGEQEQRKGAPAGEEEAAELGREELRAAAHRLVRSSANALHPQRWEYRGGRA